MILMKRRDFIKKTTASTALIGIGGFGLCSFAPGKTKHITILHTNDVHSYIDPFPADHFRLRRRRNSLPVTHVEKFLKEVKLNSEPVYQPPKPPKW